MQMTWTLKKMLKTWARSLHWSIARYMGYSRKVKIKKAE
jgi:hypothetical protein